MDRSPIATLHELVRSGLEPGVAAEQVLADTRRLERDALAADFLQREALYYRRSLDRDRERAAKVAMRRLSEILDAAPADDSENALRSWVCDAPDAISKAHRIFQLRDFRTTEFSIGDGRRFTWGEATVEIHRERIEFLNRQRAAIGETVDLHLAVIGLLLKANVSRLDDLQVDDPAERVA